MALASQGAAAVILEKDCTARGVMDTIENLLNNPKAYADMRKALVDMAVPDCAQRICAIMEELISKKSKR